jgi:hypothetical protein
MSFKAIEIEKKKYVLRGNFCLPSAPKKVYLKKEVEDDPKEFEPALQALLATDGQNTLIPEADYQAEVKERQALDKKRNAKS